MASNTETPGLARSDLQTPQRSERNPLRNARVRLANAPQLVQEVVSVTAAAVGGARVASAPPRRISRARIN